MKHKTIQWKYKKIYFGFVCFFVIILFMVSCGLIIYRIWNHFRDPGETYNAAEVYPFADDGSQSLYRPSEKEGLSSYIQSRIENILTASSVFFCFDMPTLHYQFLKHCGMNAITAQFSSGIAARDAVMEVNDNFYIGAIEADPALVDQYTDSLIQFGTQMKAQERNFVYYSFPHKEFGFSNPFYEKYFPNDIRKIEETVMANLRNAELDTVSCMDLIEEHGIRLEDLFFKTDHHWTPQSGLWGCRELAGYFNENYGYSINTSLFSMEKYQTETLENVWIGWQGQKATLAYAKPENFCIVMPKYQTDYEVFLSSKNVLFFGCMEESLFDRECLESHKKGLDGQYLYAGYGYGDQALIRIHNNLVSDGSRVLMIKASLADVMFPYFAAAVEDLDVIDLRYFDGSLRTYIKETDPDTVIVMYSAACYIESYKALFDFR